MIRSALHRWRPSSFAALALVLGSCARSVDESPFGGDGRTGIDGVFAVASLDSASFGELVREDARFMIPRPLRATIFVLDPNAYASTAAIALSGVDPDLAVGALEEAGFLRASGDPPTYEVVWPGILDDLLRIAGRLDEPGFGLGSTSAAGGPGLKRFDADGRVLLTPTVDLREQLHGVAAASDASVGDTTIAVAVDGEQFGRHVRDLASMAMQSFAAMLQVAGSRFQQGGELTPMVAANVAMRATTSLVEGLVGAVWIETATEQRLRVTSAEGGLLRRALDAFVEELGDADRYPFPDRRTEWEFGVALDPDVLVDAIDVLVAAEEGLAEVFDEARAMAALWDGRLLVAGDALGSHVAFGLRPGADPDRMPAWMAEDLDGRVERDFYVVGDGGVDWRSPPRRGSGWCRHDDATGEIVVAHGRLGVNMTR